MTLDPVVALIKSLLIPGTITFLLFGLTLGVAIAYGPGRTRRAGLPLLATLAVGYWLAAVPAFAHLLATRFHARDSGQATLADLTGARAIVVLGAGIRNNYVVAGHAVTEPDRQTIFNAVEAARLYALVPGGLPVIASGGRQQSGVGQSESEILRDWLIKAGVPQAHIVLESGSRTTREQAALVAPILEAHHWERFVLVAPAVQIPRATAVFRAQGVEPIGAAAPFVFETERGRVPGWIPEGGALRITERATYDYLAWGYYWLRGWLG